MDEGSSSTAAAAQTPKYPRVDMCSREVQPERWIAIRATNESPYERVVIPSVYEARSRMMRRLETDAEEALRQVTFLKSQQNIRGAPMRNPVY